MADSNILSEYLVKLGYSVDSDSYRKLNSMLEDAEKAVTHHATGMAKTLLAVPAGIVSAFGAVSATIIGMVDKVAMADQSYRLLGLRFLMTTESARKMDMITKALGADMGQIVWDQELHSRAVVMSQDIDHLTKMLGSDFEGNMKGIRDIRFEFSRLGIAVEFLGMKFVTDLFNKLSHGKGAFDWLQQKLEWFTENIPKWSDTLSGGAVKALEWTWDIFKRGPAILENLGTVFTNVVGRISGDKSIQGVTFSFDHFVTAIEHVGEGLKNLVVWVAQAIQDITAHLAKGDLGQTIVAKLKLAAAGLPDEFIVLGDKIGKSIVAGMLSGIKDRLPAPLKWMFNGIEAAADQVAKITVPQSDNLTDRGRAALKRSNVDSTPAVGWNSPIGLPPIAAATIQHQIQTGIGVEIPGLMDRIEKLSDRTVPAVSASRVIPTASAQSVAPVSFTVTIPEHIGQQKTPQLAYTNNNPGNLVYAGQQGAEPGSQYGKYNYAKFQTPEAGFAAIQNQIKIDSERGLTLQAYIEKYLQGDKTNDVGAYLRNAIAALGSKADTPLTQIDVSKLAQFQAKQESGSTVKEMPVPIPPTVGMSYAPVPQSMAAEQPAATVDMPKWFTEVPFWYKNAPAWLQMPAQATAVAQPDWPAAREQMRQQPAMAPQIVNNTVTVSSNLGGVYITQPGADESTIRRVVAGQLREHTEIITQRALAQLSPAWG